MTQVVDLVIPNLPVATFYHVGYDLDYPYNVCGGMQDNYNWCGPSATCAHARHHQRRWFTVQGGDGFVDDHRSARFAHRLHRIAGRQHPAAQHGDRRVEADSPDAANMTDAAKARPFRFHWDTPMMFSPNDPGKLLAGGNKLFKSTDRGDSWTAMSPDLTSNPDRDEIMTMGVKGNEIRIAAQRRHRRVADGRHDRGVAEEAGLYYTGTDDGTVSMSKDAGKTWTKRTPNMPGFPEGRVRVGGRAVAFRGRHGLRDGRWASDERLQDAHLGQQRLGATFRSLNANLAREVAKR